MDSGAVVHTSELLIEHHQTPFGTIPIYRDRTLNWYIAVAQALKNSGPGGVLDSKLLYFGQGFARSWRHRSQTVIVPGNMRLDYEQAVSRLILPLLSTKNFTFVDLGVGDFYKGYVVLDKLLMETKKAFNYVLYDISYEMLTAVLDTDIPEFKAVLKAVRDRGRLIAINAAFDRLEECEKVLPTSEQKCFGLFGNTLGSDADPLRLLECIRRALSDEDLFVAELQLLESDPPSNEELLMHFSATKSFYAGPFLALGCDDSQIELGVNTESSNSHETVNVTCRLARKFTAHIEATGYSQTIGEGEYTVLQIRKHKRQSLEQLFAESGFQIVDSYFTPTTSPGSRAFAYIAARRMPPSG